MEMLFMVLGGLGLFLYGIKLMSSGLQTIAGDRMRIILEKGTKTPIRGVLTGVIVTGLIQSSSGTTVLTVGLVNSGLLTLRQAIGVIMGANIGTTVTAYLIGFKLADYALPIVFVGVLLLCFSKNQKISTIGQSILGFGLLFYGMDIMGNGLQPLAHTQLFNDLMAQVDDNPLVGVGIGAGLAAVVQSSAATFGILQELAYQHVITYSQAVPILFGDNIGTTVTALIAGIGASVAARRASLTHFIFNVIGTLIFLPLFLLGIFPWLVENVTNILFFAAGGWDMLNVKMQIAQTHGVFNILNTCIQLPFVAMLAALVTRLIPDHSESPAIVEISKPKYLESRLLNNTPVALANASREVLHMGNYAGEALTNAANYFFFRHGDDKNQALNLENAVDNLEQAITDYVVKATYNRDISKALSDRSFMILQVVGDLERIGDHAENLVELADYCNENHIGISKEAMDSVKEMVAHVQKAFSDSLLALKTNNAEVAHSVIALDDVIDDMERDLRRGHINRLNEGKCSAGAGAVYLDVLSNLERIGDHAVNIAKCVVED